MIVGDLIDRCLNTFLLGTFSSQFNQLKTDILATQFEIDCLFPMGEITPGALIAVEDELLHVYERDDTNNRFLAVRGVRGTDAVGHKALTPIEINPRYPHFLVRSAMAEELDAWPDTLFSAQLVQLSLPSYEGMLTIPATIGRFTTKYPVRVRRQSLSSSYAPALSAQIAPSGTPAIIDDRWRRTAGWETFYGTDGVHITLDATEPVPTTYTVTVACAFNADAIDEFGDAADLEADVGLSRGMLEILELGACYRLLTSRAGVRLFPEAEGQSRSAAEVGAHDITVLANALMGMRDRAINREQLRLVKTWGFGGKFR